MKEITCESINKGGRKLSVAKGSAIGIGVAGLIAGLGYLGTKIYQKVKNKEVEPEIEYEDKYDYLHV